MKIILSEFAGCFAFSCVAETKEDAALLVHLGMNGTKEVRSPATEVLEGGEFSASLVIGKHRKAHSRVPQRR